MAHHLLLVLILISSAAAWTDDYDLCDFEGIGSGFSPEQTIKKGACTVQADPRERAQCKKQLKVAKEAMKLFVKYVNSDRFDFNGYFSEPQVFKDVKTFRLIGNGSEPRSFNDFRNYKFALDDSIGHSLIYHIEYDEEKIVENIPNKSVQLATTAWTKSGSPLAFTLTLDFNKKKLRQVTVEIEKNNEDQSAHPEGSGTDLGPLEECTDRTFSQEDNRDCQEQDRFAKRILRVLADCRIVYYYIYPKDLQFVDTYHNIANRSEWGITPTEFMRVQHELKRSVLNHYLNTFILGNLVVNIPHKSIKYNFTVAGENKSIAGSLEVVFNETGVDFIDIRTENPTWMPRQSPEYDCGVVNTNYNDCKKQVLSLEAVLDGINAFIQGDQAKELDELLRNTEIIWKKRHDNHLSLNGWGEFKPVIKHFITREYNIQKFYMDGTNHINNENIIVWNWIGKTEEKDVNMRVIMTYDTKAAKKGRNGLKQLSFQLL